MSNYEHPLAFSRTSLLGLLLVATLLTQLPQSVAAEDSTMLSIRAVALFKNKAVLDIDGKRRTVKAGAETREGVKLIEADSNKAIISLNGETMTLKLNGKITTGHDKQKHSVQLFPGEGGHYFVDGLINGHSIPFLVDTGATTIAINKNMARKIGLQYRVDGTAGRVETASGVVPAYSVSFERVQIRSITLKNVRGTVIESPYPSIALLGQSFLNRLNLHRDGIMMELTER